MKLVDGLIYEFKGKHVIRKEGDIILAGSNPSAEEESEGGAEENVERGIDFVLNHRLQEMKCYGMPPLLPLLPLTAPVSEDSATFKAYIKDFVKKVVEYMQKNVRLGRPSLLSRVYL
jgi:Translationally controlled tumour protein